MGKRQKAKSEEPRYQEIDSEEEVIKMAEQITIKAPNFQTAEFVITGTAPYMQSAFSKRKKMDMKKDHELGTKEKEKRRKNKPPRNFNQEYEEAKHISLDGWNGIPCSAFRNGMIDACRMCGFKMTHAKLTVFVKENGYDRDSLDPLTKITKGIPKMYMHRGINTSGVTDLRARPVWKPGWQAIVSVRWDADQFKLEDVTNLLSRVGVQVGIGEGRPFSKKSAGMGFGLFSLENGNGFNKKQRRSRQDKRRTGKDSKKS